MRGAGQDTGGFSLFILSKLGYTLCGTTNTSLFYEHRNIDILNLNHSNIIELLAKNEIDLVINIPSNIYNSNNTSNGYIMRRKCIDSNISLITNIKCARLFVASLKEYMSSNIDYKSWNEYIINI